MRDLPLSTVLKAALISGLAAGLAVAVFHLLATESVIDRAIAFEQQLRQAEGAAEKDPLVSRDAQQGGLVLGFLLYGLTWSLLFGAMYHLAQRWLPAVGYVKQGLMLAVIGYWTVGLFPFLKYPSNPPGVGDPETIAYRQSLYLALLALSVGGTTLAMALARAGPGRWLPALAFLAAFGAVVYLVLPSNPDPIHMPTRVVGTFRGLSLMGLTLFWAVLGLTFGLLLRRQQTGGLLRPPRFARM